MNRVVRQEEQKNCSLLGIHISWKRKIMGNPSKIPAHGNSIPIFAQLSNRSCSFVEGKQDALSTYSAYQPVEPWMSFRAYHVSTGHLLTKTQNKI